MTKHTLTMMGGPHDELRVSVSVFLEAMSALLEGARLATRFAVEGESVRYGPRPAWLDAACALEITGLAPGSAVISMEAPTLKDADARFGDDRQRALFEDIEEGFGDHTAVELFGQILSAVVERDPDHIVADRALLDACVRFAKVSGDGYEGVCLEGLRNRDEPLVVKSEHVPMMELLRDETPAPQAARVSGTLDTISVSRSNLILKLKDGTRIPARMESHDPDALRRLFGKRVVVSGMAHYRPSGRLMMVDVEFIGEAGPRDRFFEAAPTARKRAPLASPAVQGESSGVLAFYGTWPGDETEAELLEALQAIG